LPSPSPARAGNQVADDTLVTPRFLEGLAERLAVHHQVAEDGPTAGLGKFAHVQAKIRVVDVLRRPVLDAQVGLDRDVGVRRAHRLRFDVQRAQEGVDIHLERVEVQEHLRQHGGRDGDGFGRSHA
jgi:hypothetical protein